MHVSPLRIPDFILEMLVIIEDYVLLLKAEPSKSVLFFVHFVFETVFFVKL